MKKHKLLTKAMQDYPIGSIAIFKSAPNVKHVSDGKFQINKWWDEEYGKGNRIVVNSGNGQNCFYDNGEWAEIVDEKWIEEQNKPKEIEVELYFITNKAIVSKDSIKIKHVEDNFIKFELKPSDIEDIAHALKTLTK